MSTESVASMQSVYLDFETYYDKEYSLSKMPTMQYVRDGRFQALGCALYIPGDFPKAWVTPDRLGEVLGRVPWSKSRLVAHNTAFDGAVLSERYGHIAAQYDCTMLRARWWVAQGVLSPDQLTSLAALAPLVGMAKENNYAAIQAMDTRGAIAQGLSDLDILIELDKKLAGVPALEADLIDLHVRMAVDPVFELDENLLAGILRDPEPGDSEYSAFAARKELAEAFRSPELFASVLRDFGVEPGVKPGKKGSIYAFAKSDAFMQELLDSEDEEIRMLAEIRVYGRSTIERTRAQTFVNVGSPLPVPALYYGTLTGRSAGNEGMNLLNLNRGGRLRRSLRAPDGYVVMPIDSGQIEVRTTAMIADCTALVEGFRHSDSANTAEEAHARDLYRRFGGERLYHVDPVDVDDVQRQVAKAALLALGFGQGRNGFTRYCKRSRVPMEETFAEYVVDTYRRTYWEIPALWRKLEREALHRGYAELPSGRRICYPGLERGDWVEQDGKNTWIADSAGNDMSWDRPSIFSRRGKRERRKFWHGAATENVASGTARDVVMQQTINLKKQGWHIALSVYDEAVMIVPEDMVSEARAAALEAFSTPPEWMPTLPVKGKVGVAKAYGDAK